MQWEYSYFYPAIAQCNHITDWSKVGIKFRTDVAMMGKMGYDIVVSKLDEKELLFSQNALKNYANLKETIWHGDMHRLVNPFENQMASVQFVNEKKDQSVIFNYLTENRYDLTSLLQNIKLKGLDVQKKYKITEINLYPETKSSINSEKIYSGEYLMTIGFNPNISNRRTSVVLEVNEVR
jgi:alpha-galactosidase